MLSDADRFLVSMKLHANNPADVSSLR